MEERLREEVEELNLTIKLSGNSFELKVDPNITLEEFKGIIEKRISVPSENITLILNGRQLLLLESTLLELNVPRGCTIYLTVSRKDYIPSSVPLEPIGPTAEEKMMEQMMDNPVMASMFNNPEFMKSIMESNPQMKKVLDANPQLRQIMSDPATMNEMMRTMRNPSLRREMMRNTDRTMSAIENMPGGFNELRKIYQQIQEPMESALDGMTEEQASSSSSSSSSRTNDATPNTEALPNPWARPANNNNANLFGSSMGLGGPNMNMFGGGSAGGQPMAFPSLNDPMVQSILNNPELMNSIMSSMAGPSGGGLGAGLGNFGGSGLGNLGGGPGGQGFPSFNDPMVQSMLNNPQLMNSIMSSFGGGTGGGLGGGFGGLGNANPQMPFPSMNDPILQSMLNNPQLMNSMLGSMGGGLGGSGGFNGASGFNNAPNANPNPFLFGAPSPAPNVVRPVPTNPASTSIASPSQPAVSTASSSPSSPAPQSAQATPQPSQSASQPTQAQPAQTQSLEERYSIQISQMNEMGLTDTAKIIEALQQTRGDVERALELMFSM